MLNEIEHDLCKVYIPVWNKYYDVVIKNEKSRINKIKVKTSEKSES